MYRAAELQSEFQPSHLLTHTHTHTPMYSVFVFISVAFYGSCHFVCVCVPVPWWCSVQWRRKPSSWGGRRWRWQRWGPEFPNPHTRSVFLPIPSCRRERDGTVSVTCCFWSLVQKKHTRGIWGAKIRRCSDFYFSYAPGLNLFNPGSPWGCKPVVNTWAG